MLRRRRLNCWRLDCHRQLSEVMTEVQSKVQSTEVTEVTNTDSVEATELEAADAGGGDASTAVACNHRRCS